MKRGESWEEEEYKGDLKHNEIEICILCLMDRRRKEASLVRKSLCGKFHGDEVPNERKNLERHCLNGFNV